MSGAMLAPALNIMSKDLHISEAEASMALSIYILAFAFGPMILAPCSEVWGRRPIWIVGGAWYIFWNTLCGVSKNQGVMVLGRLMAGLGASAEFAVGTSPTLLA
jgi:predicted MFS family arabinose efflux permease